MQTTALGLARQLWKLSGAFCPLNNTTKYVLSESMSFGSGTSHSALNRTVTSIWSTSSICSALYKGESLMSQGASTLVR
jgi:hypothetical protein